MLKAFLKAIEQLGDPAIRRVLWLSLGLSALTFAVVWILVGWLLTQTSLFETGWLNAVVDVLGGFATLALSWLLFPAVVSTTTGFFLDGVAEAVDRRHYPALPPARRQPVGEVVVSALKFFAVTVALNLFALLFLLIPPAFPFVFYGSNGYLLGREYFEAVAARRLAPAEMAALRRRYRGPLFAAGVVIALLLTIPFANLLAPLVATAAMVHLLETLRRGGRVQSFTSAPERGR